MNSKFYVYELWNPLKQEPFYIGKGKGEGPTNIFTRPKIHINTATGILKRPLDFNRHKINTIKKIISMGTKPEVKIILITENEKEAFDKEKELIKFYGRIDLHTGCLTNLTNGGEGGSGRVWKEESKRKVSDTVRKAGGPWMKGKKHSALSILLMKASHKSHPTKYQVTEETKELISNLQKKSYQKGTNPFFTINKLASKPVFQIDLNGFLVQKWPSLAIASRQLKLGPSVINQTIKKGDERPTLAYGYYWRYENQSPIENGKLKNIDDLNTRRLIATTKTIGVIQSNLQDKVIKIWPSSSAVEKTLGLRSQYIYEIIKGKKKPNIFNGYKWSPVNEALC